MAKQIIFDKPIWKNMGPEYRAFGEQQRSTDYAVVGLGISGASAVHRLAEARRDFCAFEKGRIGGAAGGKNGGAVLLGADQHGIRSLEMAMGKTAAHDIYKQTNDARDELIRLQAEGADFRMRPSKGIQLADSKRSLMKLSREEKALVKNGFSARFLGQEELRREMQLGEAVIGALVHHDVSVLDPLALVSELCRITSLKVGRESIYENSGVLGITREGNGFMLSIEGGGKVFANKVIIATEALTGELNLPSKIELIIKGDSLAATEPLPRAKLEAAGFSGDIFFWAGRKHHLFIRLTEEGRFMIDTGLLHPNGLNQIKSEKFLQGVREKLAQLIPVTEGAELSLAWSAKIANSPDFLPIVGRDPKDPWISLCMGFGGQGITMGFLSGKLAADLSMGRVGESQQRLLKYFDPGRFRAAVPAPAESA